ncbi:hypothetical protein [Salinibacterium sp. ZJ450]|uniref:hypothetical protein n=1 Tax=Salinibacterium sp. ZJ450 TaxID=2708338 RepID=UPI00141E1935|nr:hypothetical protein [Salinibacterium sp. ZJ450]
MKEARYQLRQSPAPDNPAIKLAAILTPQRLSHDTRSLVLALGKSSAIVFKHAEMHSENADVAQW